MTNHSAVTVHGVPRRRPHRLSGPATLPVPQGLLRYTMVDASCIQIKPGGSPGGNLEFGRGRQLYYDSTPEYMTNKRTTNNKLLSVKSHLSPPPLACVIFSSFMAEQHNRLLLHPFYLLIDLQISLLSVCPFCVHVLDIC